MSYFKWSRGNWVILSDPEWIELFWVIQRELSYYEWSRGNWVILSDPEWIELFWMIQSELSYFEWSRGNWVILNMLYVNSVCPIIFLSFLSSSSSFSTFFRCFSSSVFFIFHLLSLPLPPPPLSLSLLFFFFFFYSNCVIIVVNTIRCSPNFKGWIHLTDSNFHPAFCDTVATSNHVCYKGAYAPKRCRFSNLIIRPCKSSPSVAASR